MAGRVEEHSEGCPRLVAMLGGTQLEDGRLRSVEVVDLNIDVHLLGHLLSRPTRSGEPLHLLEADGVAMLGAYGPPAVTPRHLPVEEGAVERRQSLGVGAVEDESGIASDSHGTTVKT